MFDNLYTKEILERNLAGYWYREPTSTWSTERVAISKGECIFERNNRVLFLAIDEETWGIGSQNKGIYAGWKDTHESVLSFQHLVSGVVAQRPIPKLDKNIPQFIVENSYNAIRILANFVMKQKTGEMIAITGTAGKSTSKDLLNHLLSHNNSVIATRGNHNTRTGVPLTISCGIEDPDYLIVESAISGLWMGKNGVLEDYIPDIGLITSIDGGQRLTPRETAIYKARVATSMKPNSPLILNRDMMEYETVYNQVKDKQLNIITYGNQHTYDSYIISTKEEKGATNVGASILGEVINFTVPLIGKGMIYNTIGVLTIIKLLGHDLNKVLDKLNDFQTGDSVLKFEDIPLGNNEKCTILDDGWNATGIAMIETIDLFSNQSKYFEGKKIAILGRIENLGKDAKRQHKELIKPIIDSSIDIVFAHGPEMKYVLEGLPETLIGGYFNNAKELAQHVGRIVTNNDFILIKGSPRSSDFKHMKKYVSQMIKTSAKPIIQRVNYNPLHTTGYGALTVRLSDNKVMEKIGDTNTEQNQGLGNVLLLHHVLKSVFDRKLDISEMYIPTSTELNENKSPRAIPLHKNVKVSLYDLILTSIVNWSPNALLLIANQVLESNRDSMKLLRRYRDELELNKEAVLNITGRRISNRRQTITLNDLMKVGRLLFDKQSSSLSYLRTNQYFYKGKLYDVKTNLFDYGYITHGLFFGDKDSVAITLSRFKGEDYLTTVIGAPNAYKRDLLIRQSLSVVLDKEATADSNEYLPYEVNNNDEKTYKIHFLGDTYFGEFYTKLRNRQGKEEDALVKYGRDYSFKGIQPFFSQGDYNIANFEAVLSDGVTDDLRERKRYTLHANIDETIPALKRQNIHAVTLANNHLMDFGECNLQNTVKAFYSENILPIGAGSNLAEAERYLVKYVNNKRISIFSGYWYREQMYRSYDFYAFHDKPGVASLSGNMIQLIEKERAQYPNSIIVVVAHWGVDFERVRLKQREYAKALSEAGANIIIGHGSHLLQEVEYFNETLIVYSIGNGIFNSNGEYKRRGAPPYSFLAQFNIGEVLNLRLYPIQTNNLKTFWQPRFANESEVKHIDLLLKSYNNQLNYQWQIDDKKHFIEFPIS